MTTVGYGGSRTTELGRVITIALLLVGIGFVAVLTGAVADGSSPPTSRRS